MSRDPVLACRRLPTGTNGHRVPLTFKVHGGLHYLRGNSSPYFSLTSWSHRAGFPNQCQSGGADHETILKYYPKFADLAALHLSDIDGKPMHSSDNGWYDIAGALPNGANQKYHAGNSERNFPCEAPADKPWKTTVSRKPTPTECLDIFARHWRIDIEEARRIAYCVSQFIAALPNGWLSSGEAIKAAAMPALIRMQATMLPRWKAQADACIATHGLVVYGDPWTSTAREAV